MKAWMHENATPLERLECLASRERAEKAHVTLDPQRSRKPLEPPPFGTVSDNPILGVSEFRLGESQQSEVKALQREEPPDADEPHDRIASLCSLAQLLQIVVGEPHPRMNFHRCRAQASQSVLSFGGRGERSCAPPRGQSYEGVALADPSRHCAQHFVGEAAR